MYLYSNNYYTFFIKYKYTNYSYANKQMYLIYNCAFEKGKYNIIKDIE